MVYIFYTRCSISFIVLGVLVVCNSNKLYGGEEYCERDIFEPSCGDNEVIVMKSAFYGRMAIGKCIQQNYGHIGCKADVLSIMDGFCSGRQSCSVKASHDVLLESKANGCPRDMAAYLVPQYECLSVSKHVTCQDQGMVLLKEDSSYISIQENDIIGSSQCPWKINLSPGKKVNLTMMSFPPTPTTTNSVPSSACYEIGIIKEKGKTKTIHKCLNDPRHKQIYLSSGGPVEIVIPNKETLGVSGYFVLHYQGIGCSTPRIPTNAEMQMTKDHVVIECKTSNQKWELSCTDGLWVGEIGQCSDESSGWSFLGLFGHDHPYGTAIVVGLGATLGVLVGGILLYIIIAIFKRCQKSDYVMTYEYTDPNFAHIPTDYHADKSNLLLQDDKLFEQNSNTWRSQLQGNGNTLSRGGGTDHSRVPLPPLPNECNTLSYEKPLYNRNGNV